MARIGGGGGGEGPWHCWVKGWVGGTEEKRIEEGDFFVGGGEIGDAMM